MAKTRSPNYPQLDLKTAIDAMRAVFRHENRNRMSRKVLAHHLGHSNVNGRAMVKIGAIRAYGLIDGSGDELKLSEDAINAISAPANTPIYIETVQKCALNPSLFRDLYGEFDGRPSEENLRYKLVQLKFTEAAAQRAARSFFDTMDFANVWGNEIESYDDVLIDQPSEEPATCGLDRDSHSSYGSAKHGPKGAGFEQEANNVPPPDLRREIFALDEGDVTIIYPEHLSEDSFEDLAAYFDLFLKKAKRRAQRSAEDQ